jgi:hypothetical protein
MFPRSWYTIQKEGAHFTVSCDNCPSVYPEFIKSTNLPASYSVELRLAAGYYESLYEIVNEMNSVVSKTFAAPVQAWSADGIERRAHESNWPRFMFNVGNQRVYATLTSNMSIQYSPSLAAILGIGPEQNPMKNMDEDTLTVKGNLVSDIEGGIHSIYVYCDILEHVPVGDTKAPLLRIVDAGGEHGEMLYKSFDNLLYMPLQKKNFDSIEIDIRNSFGEPIAFESGQLVATLHFRRAVNPYFL